MSKLVSSRTINLGACGDGSPLLADLDIILRTSLLLPANSGGGKSWALRRMIEQSFGIVPQIVIDPEGEFATLRSKYDFVLVGKGGDTPADVRSAPLLARRLLELGASAVVDLYEMPKGQRPAWVAAFLQALVDAPKDLWHDLLVYVDEIHEFAPEAGHGARDDGATRASKAALTDLASKGRKRGFGLVAATQRLAKFSKDVAAELKNVLVGMTWIDIDRERAADALGILRKSKQDFFAEVKMLAPGSFYALGRGLTLEPTLFRTGAVVTEHPEAGRRQSAPPPPTAKILHLLPKLSDLPREAEEKIATEKELREEVARLTRELTARTQRTAPEEPAMDLGNLVQVVGKSLTDLDQIRGVLVKKLDENLDVLHGRLIDGDRMLAELVKGKATRSRRPLVVPVASRTGKGSLEMPRGRKLARPGGNEIAISLPTGEHRVLAASAQHASQGGVTREQLTVLCGYKRSSRDTFIQRLRFAELLSLNGDKFLPTDYGMRVLGDDFEELPTGRALLEHWRQKLPEGERRVLDCAVDSYPGGVSRDKIDEITGYKRSSRDTFIQRLRARQLVTRSDCGVRASDMLF